MLPVDLPRISLQLYKRTKNLEVVVIESPEGEERAEGNLPSESLSRTPNANTSRDSLIRIGKQLYSALLSGNVRKLFEACLRKSDREGLQIELRFDPDQIKLAQYPWELLTDEFDQFLALRNVHITRYITYSRAPGELQVALSNDTILQATPRPQTLPSLQIIEVPPTLCRTLIPPTYDALKQQLLFQRASVLAFHFDGHGAVLHRCRECDRLNSTERKRCIQCYHRLTETDLVGVLAFEKLDHSLDLVAAHELGTILYNSNVKFAVLAACETAAVGGQSLFGGLAPQLLLAGVPAVVGMQAPILDRDAVVFIKVLYEQMQHGQNLFKAVHRARLTLDKSWYIPTLYLRHKRKEEVAEPQYLLRNIDSTVPKQTVVGKTFLARLWLRRAGTSPTSETALREILSIPPHIPVETRTFQADVRFDPIPGRSFRRGEVSVNVNATGLRVTPPVVMLFVDEHIDAPPAIFTVKALNLGKATMVFTLRQDGGIIASLSHAIEVCEVSPGVEIIVTTSHSVAVNGERGIEAQQPSEPSEVTMGIAKAEAVERAGEFEQAAYLYNQLSLRIADTRGIVIRRLKRLEAARNALSLARNAEQAKDYFLAYYLMKIIEELYADMTPPFVKNEMERLSSFLEYGIGGTWPWMEADFFYSRAVKKLSKTGVKLTLKLKLVMWRWSALSWLSLSLVGLIVFLYKWYLERGY